MPKSIGLQWIFKYIKETIEFWIVYMKSHYFKLLGYSGADIAGDIDDRKPNLTCTHYIDN